MCSWDEYEEGYFVYSLESLIKHLEKGPGAGSIRSLTWLSYMLHAVVPRILLCQAHRLLNSGYVVLNTFGSHKYAIAIYLH
jgi:hypothetical protein